MLAPLPLREVGAHHAPASVSRDASRADRHLRCRASLAGTRSPPFASISAAARARRSFRIRDLTEASSLPRPPLPSSSLPRLTGMVGDDALVDYPHPRHACAVFKFETTNHRTHCPNCWYDANDAPRAFSLSRSSARALREGGFECAQSRASVAAKIAHLALFFFSRRTLTSPSRPRPRAGATAATCRRRAATGRSTATRRLARTSGTPCAAASSPAARRLAPRTTFPAPTPRLRRLPARPRLLP